MTDQPRPPLPLASSPVVLATVSVDEDGDWTFEEHGHAMRQCKGNIHVFRERPGACQCGGEYWYDEDAEASGRYLGRLP